MSFTSNLSFLKNVFNEKKSLPSYLIYEPTSKCNSNCRFCYNWKNNNSEKPDLTAAQIDKFSKSINSNLIVLLLSGGEPFLRFDLPEIISIFYQNTGMRYLSIPTNGLLPETVLEKTLKILEFYKGNLVISLSLDSLGASHNFIRGSENNFKELLKTYHLLSGINNKNLELSVCTCLSNKNAKDLPYISSFVKDNMPQVSCHAIGIMRGDPPDKNFRPPSLYFLGRNQKLLKKITARGSFSFDPFNKIIKTARRKYFDIILEKGKRKWDCYAGSLAAYINFEGRVYPCEMLGPIGLLKDYDYDFKKVWFSKSADRARKQIKEKACKCRHSCFINFSTICSYAQLFSLRFLKKGGRFNG